MRKVIVNICTYKRHTLLIKCLKSVLAQEVPADWDVEVLVVDNDSSSDLLEKLSPIISDLLICIHYIIEPSNGIPYARNSACNKSLELGADFIIFLDDDEEACPGWLLAYENASETIAADVFTGPARLIFPQNHEQWLGNKRMKHLKHGQLLKRAATNNVMIASSLFSGGSDGNLQFDVNMRYTGGSDTDFFMRVVHNGGRIVFVSDAIVTEEVVKNRLRLLWRLNRQYSSSCSHVYTLIKLYGFKQVWVKSLKEVVRHIFEGCLRLIGSPLYLFVGYIQFKHCYYHGLRHFSKAAGNLAGLIGRHPEPYKYDSQVRDAENID